MTAPRPGAPLSPVLVGRETHLVVLRDLLASAAGGRGGTALCSGDAGVGKSRLIHEAARLAAAKGFAVLSGQAFERDECEPFAPLVDMLRAQAALGSPRDLAAAWGPHAAELARLLPELGVSVAAPSPDLPAWAATRRTHEALAAYVAATAAERPVLLVVEDAHWADEATLEWLLLAAMRAPAQAVALLVSYRTGEVGEPLGRLLEVLRRQRLALELRLAPLTREEVGAMLRAAFGLDRPVKEGFLAALHDLTEGNPFFVEEVVGALAAGGATASPLAWDRRVLDDLHVPARVHDAVRRQLARVGRGARDLLEVAAVLGRRFDFGLVRDVTGWGDAELLALVKEAVATRLVEEESAERFGFRHALTREAVYAGLLVRERRDLHGRVAQVLERRAASAPDPTRLSAELAHHWFGAERWDRAERHARAAGERALAQDAPAAAARLLTMALEAAARAGRPEPAGLRCARGRAYAALGTFEAARQDLEACVAEAFAGGDREREWRTTVELGRLWAARDYARSREFFVRALDLATAWGDQLALARTLNRLGNWHMNVDEPDAALAFHERALALLADRPHESETRRELAVTHDLMAIAASVLYEEERALRHFSEAIAVFEELGDRRSLAACRINRSELRGHWSLYLGSTFREVDPHGALRECEAALAETRALDWRSGEACALLTLAGGHAFRGEYDLAFARGRLALEVAEETGNAQWQALAHVALANASLDLFDAPGALTHAGEALRMAHELGSPVYVRFAGHYLARAHLLAGDVGAAGAVLDELAPSGMPMRTAGQRLLWVARAEHALARDEAASALAVTLDLITRTGPDGHGRPAPYLDLLRGRALARLGRLDEAAAAREQRWRQVELRAALAMGRLLRRRRRVRESEAWRAGARGLAAELAATVPDAAARQAFLARVAALAPAPARPAADRDALTPRERQVTAHEARGLTNKAIAKELGLSARTVEKHVSNVLAKLGLRTRAQLAARQASATPLPEPPPARR